MQDAKIAAKYRRIASQVPVHPYVAAECAGPAYVDSNV